MDHVSKSVELYHQFLNEMQSGDYTSDLISLSQEPDLLLGDNDSIVRIELVPGLETCRKDLLDGKRTPSPDGSAYTNSFSSTYTNSLSNAYTNSLRKHPTRYPRHPIPSSKAHHHPHSPPSLHPFTLAPQTESTPGSCIYPDDLESDLDDDLTDDDDDDRKNPDAPLGNPVVPGLFPSMDVHDTAQFASPEVLPLVPSYTVDDPAAYI